MCLLTIIIPVKLPCANLKTTLHSLMDQTIDKVEVILVTTRDLEVEQLEILARTKLGYRVVCQQATGVSSAMNYGVTQSRGEFIYFLGSGDTLLPKVLSSVIDRIAKTKAKLLIFKVIMPSGLTYPGFHVGVENIQTGFMPCHQGIVMSRDLIVELAGFDERYSIAADFDLLLRATRRDVKLENYDLSIAKYLGGGLSCNGALGEQFLSLYRNGFYLDSFRFIFVECAARFYRQCVRARLNTRG